MTQLLDRPTTRHTSAPAPATNARTSLCNRLITASNLPQVRDAWALVYHVYSQAGLIDENPHQLHTSPCMIGDRTAVFARYDADGLIQATLSTVADGPDGLPLDSVYPDELDALRRQGVRLSEVGLFADASQLLCDTNTLSDGSGFKPRGTARQCAEMLIELTAMAFYFARYWDVETLLIGVHPRHAPFYERMWGFEHYGEERSYAAVNHRPVVLMRQPWQTWVDRPRQPRAFARTLHDPIPHTQFDGRYRFDPRLPAFHRSPLGQWLVMTETTGTALAESAA